MAREPKDTQRKRVYAWGWNLPAKTTSAKCETLKEAEELARQCFEAVPTARTPSVVINGRLRACSRACYGSKKIELAPGWGLTREVVIHEAAHFSAGYPARPERGIMAGRISRNIASHGPEFMRANIDMLAAVEGYSTRRLELSAYIMGIKVADMAKAPAGWPKLKRTVAELVKYQNRNPGCKPVTELVQMVINGTPLGLLQVFAEGARDEARRLWIPKRIKELERDMSRAVRDWQHYRGLIERSTSTSTHWLRSYAHWAEEAKAKAQRCEVELTDLERKAA